MKHGRLLRGMLALILLTAGCSAWRESVRHLGAGLGAIQTRDLDQAQYVREKLPTWLGMAAEQIEVKPGSGQTEVIIRGVNDPAEQERIIARVEAFRDQTSFSYGKEKVPCNPIFVSFK